MIYRLINLLAFLLLLIALDSCSGESRPETLYYENDEILLSSDPNIKPEWTKHESGVVNIEGIKYVWFKGMGKSKSNSEQSARLAAEADAQAKVSKALNVLIATQFKQTWETIGEGNREDMERVRRGITVSRSKTRLHNFRVLDLYKEKIGIVKYVKGGRPIFKYTEYHVYVRMAMPYEDFIRYRDQIIERIRKRKANSRQRRIIRKVKKELNKVDELESYELQMPSKE